MASNPFLFGLPPFGTEERDQFMRVLMMFLQDPFQGMAQNIGGDITVNTGWKIPAGNITGSIGGGQIWKYNAFGIRELNEFSEARTLAHGASLSVSDRPGLLLVWPNLGYHFGVFALRGTGGGATIVASSGTPTTWTTTHGNSGTLNVSDTGTGTWEIENLTGSALNLYMVIISMGEQRESGYSFTEFFTGDGSTTSFTVSNPPIASVRVYLNDVLQEALSDYDVNYPTNDAIVFFSAPGSGSTIRVEYGN